MKQLQRLPKIAPDFTKSPAVTLTKKYRGTRKSSRFTGEEIPEDLADDREEVIEGIIRREEYRSLYRAIGLLPDTQKEVITLFYFSGLPIKSISEITGKSETNVKVLLCRAREKLRTIMEEEQ